MSNTAPSWVTYEHPLGERIRTMLRLEFLLETAVEAMEGERVLDSRTSIEAFVGALGILDRGDIRSEYIKELDRLGGGLSRIETQGTWPEEQVADEKALCRDLLNRIDAAGAGLGQALRDDELLSAVSQRIAVGAGTGGFDLPAYHRWLTQPYNRRREDLERWLDSFSDLHAATSLILRLQRDTATFDTVHAEDGTWQYRPPFDSRPVQLIRTRVPSNSTLFPEVSGNRHLITIRFLSQPDTATRPAPAREDVPFQLAICDL